MATSRSYSSPGFSSSPNLPQTPYSTPQPQYGQGRQTGYDDYGSPIYQQEGGQSGSLIDPNSWYPPPPQQPQGPDIYGTQVSAPPSNPTIYSPPPNATTTGGGGQPTAVQTLSHTDPLPGASPTIYAPPPNATATSGGGQPTAVQTLSHTDPLPGAGGGGLAGLNNIPAFSGANGGSFNIEGVGSVTNGSDIPAYQAQLGLQGQNNSSLAQMLASMFGSQAGLDSALGTARIGSDTSRYNADQGLAATGLQTGAQRYGADQGLAGIQAQTAAQTSVAETNAAAQRYAAEQANVPAQLQNARITGTMVPLFQRLLSQYGPGGGSGSSRYMAGALSSFSPQQQQAASNASDAAVERAREQARQENALQYAGNGYGASSPQIMARNAAIDAASAGAAQAGQRQINQDFGTNRSANWLSAMNAQQGALNPILSLFGQLLG